MAEAPPPAPTSRYSDAQIVVATVVGCIVPGAVLLAINGWRSGNRRELFGLATFALYVFWGVASSVDRFGSKAWIPIALMWALGAFVLVHFVRRRRAATVRTHHQRGGCDASWLVPIAINRVTAR